MEIKERIVRTVSFQSIVRIFQLMEVEQLKVKHFQDRLKLKLKINFYNCRYLKSTVPFKQVKFLLTLKQKGNIKKLKENFDNCRYLNNTV